MRKVSIVVITRCNNISGAASSVGFPPSLFCTSENAANPMKSLTILEVDLKAMVQKNDPRLGFNNASDLGLVDMSALRFAACDGHFQLRRKNIRLCFNSLY